MNIEFSLTLVLVTVFSKGAMEGVSDALMAAMTDIVDKAQELAKSKIAVLPIAQNQPTGPPTITNPPVGSAAQSSTEGKPARKRTQQYAEWDIREYTSSKDGRQKQLDAREEQRVKAQMESTKCDMLVYKQMVFELKTVLKTEKDKKVKKALVMEIQANEYIIKTMIRSGIPDVPLHPEIKLQITVDKNKTSTQTGSKSPRMRSQAAMEDENEKAKNRSNRQQEKETEQEEHEIEDDKAKNRRKHMKGKVEESDEGDRGARKGSDKASNRKQASADTMDLFALPDFLDDDEEDPDFEPPVRKKGKRKAVPLIEDDEEDDDNEEQEEDRVDDDNDEEEDEDYVVDEGDDDDGQDDDEEDDGEIMLQAGKAEQRKRKRQTKVADVVEERRTVGQHCANVDQATEFRKYICDLMKTFEEHVRAGKQVKKYLLEMIQDVREACMNMRYPGMDFNPEEIMPTISDPSFKAWRAMLNGVEFADRNDMKEANTRRNANIVTSDRSNKDAGQVARSTINNLPTAQRNDCKQILRRLIKHNTEVHKSAAKTGGELMALLEYFPILAWLQVADVTTRPLVYVQVPEVVEIVKQAQVVFDKKKP